MNATYTALLIACSPLLVAWIRTDDWPSGRVAGLAVGVALVLYVLGRELDGALTWPLPATFLPGFIAAVTAQQALHLLIAGTSFLQWLEAVGTPVPEQPQPGDQQ